MLPLTPSILGCARGCISHLESTQKCTLDWEHFHAGTQLFSWKVSCWLCFAWQNKGLVSAQKKMLCREAREGLASHGSLRTRGWQALPQPSPAPSSKAPGQGVRSRCHSIPLDKSQNLHGNALKHDFNLRVPSSQVTMLRSSGTCCCGDQGTKFLSCRFEHLHKLFPKLGPGYGPSPLLLPSTLQTYKKSKHFNHKTAFMV